MASAKLNALLLSTAMVVVSFSTARAENVSAVEGASQASVTESADSADGDIVVTAQKRSERLADVPLSISVVTGDQVVKNGIMEPTQLGKMVPGFSYQQSAFGSPILSIRGIGFNDNSTTSGPTVTSYIDQVALPYSIMSRGAMLDLERVEVLKGPQGTLFGMNSTGGAINFIAAKPTSEFAAGADVSYGRFNVVDVRGFVSGPLSDTVRARLALQHERGDGWQKSATRPGDKLGKKDFTNGRLLIDWTPSDTLSFELAASAWHDGSESQAAQFVQFSPAVPVNPTTQYVADAMGAAPATIRNARDADWDAGNDYSRDDDFYQFSLRGDWNATDEVTVTSITSYSKFRGEAPIDIDGTAFTAFNLSSHKSYLTSFAQELRVSGDHDRVRWMIGGNYQKDVANETTISQNNATNNYLFGFMFTRLGQIAEQDIKTASVFGSLDYKLTDKLTLQGSLRYSDQKRDFGGCIRDEGAGTVGVPAATAFGFLATVLSGQPTVIPAGGCLTLDAATFAPGLAKSKLNEDNLSWRIGADYKFSSRGMVYANITKGYKAGSYALVPGILSSQFTPVTQESVLAYEAGVRVSTDDNALSVDLAGFYMDYRDKQLKGVVLTPVFGPLPQLVNIPKSEVYGFELNVVAKPVQGVRLSAGVTHVATKVLKDPVAPAEPRDPFGVLTSYIGDSFPDTPRWQMVGDAEYRFPVNSDGMMAFVGASVNYRSGTTSMFAGDATFHLPEYALLDLRLGLESADGRWTGQIWGRNVTNKYYWTNVTHLTDYVSRLSGTPATYGVTLGFRY